MSQEVVVEGAVPRSEEDEEDEEDDCSPPNHGEHMPSNPYLGEMKKSPPRPQSEGNPNPKTPHYQESSVIVNEAGRVARRGKQEGLLPKSAMRAGTALQPSCC